MTNLSEQTMLCFKDRKELLHRIIITKLYIISKFHRKPWNYYKICSNQGWITKCGKAKFNQIFQEAISSGMTSE